MSTAATPVTVSGVLRTPAGLPAGGVRVDVELMPAGGYRSPGGAQAHIVATGATDATGAFGLTVPITHDVRAEGDFNGGVVNMFLLGHRAAVVTPTSDLPGPNVNTVVASPKPAVVVGSTPSPNPSTNVTTTVGGRLPALVGSPPSDPAGGALSIGYAFYAPMQEQQDTALGLALQPVNLGVLFMAQAQAMAGHTTGVYAPNDTGVAVDEEPTSADQPGPPLADTPNGTYDPLPVVPPYVGPPAPPVDTTIIPTNPPMPELPEVVAQDAGSGGSSSYPTDVCQDDKNTRKWVVVQHGQVERLEPVSEVHASNDMKVQFTYTNGATTDLGVGIDYNQGDGWGVSGSAAMRNGKNFTHRMAVMDGPFYRYADAEFNYVYEYLVFCDTPAENPGGGGDPYWYDRIRSTIWTGGLAYGTQNLEPLDQKDDWQKAVDDHRASFMKQRDYVAVDDGKTYVYKRGVSAFGVTLSSQSSYDTSHKTEMWSGTARATYHIWGDKDYPAGKGNHAIYAYS